MKALLLVLLLSGCVGPRTQVLTPMEYAQIAQEPPSITYWWNLTPTQPATMHLYIYGQMEECLGIEGGNFGEIQWAVADFVMRADFVRLAGLWMDNPRRILLAKDRFNDPSVVSHEIIHDLTRGAAEENGPAFERCEIKPL